MAHYPLMIHNKGSIFCVCMHFIYEATGSWGYTHDTRPWPHGHAASASSHEPPCLGQDPVCKHHHQAQRIQTQKEPGSRTRVWLVSPNLQAHMARRTCSMLVIVLTGGPLEGGAPDVSPHPPQACLTGPRPPCCMDTLQFKTGRHRKLVRCSTSNASPHTLHQCLTPQRPWS